MDLELTGRTALVTGGSRGIGWAVALELATEGCDVAIVARDADRLARAAAEIAEATGRTIVPIAADVRRRAEVDAIPGEVARRLRPIDILVNAASAPGGLALGPLEEVTDEAMLEDLNTKYLGYLRCARALAPAMKERGWGRLIHVAGSSARQSGTYSGGGRNIAVVHLSKTLSDELGPFGITSNVVHPSETETEWFQAAIALTARESGVSEAAAREPIAARNATRRIPGPQDIAWVVAFLASPKAGAVTGETIGAGGGALRGVTL